MSSAIVRINNNGDYQSPVIHLIDIHAGQEPVIGGAHDGVTLLKPDADYRFQVDLRCEGVRSPLLPGKVTVRFWEFDGGLGTFGNLLEEQNAEYTRAGSWVSAGNSSAAIKTIE